MLRRLCIGAVIAGTLGGSATVAGQSAAAPDRTVSDIALTGCLTRMEGSGSGTAGSSAGPPGGGGYVLRSAVRSAPGGGGRTPDPAGARTATGTASATSGSDYRLVPGTTRLDLSAFVGQRVEVTGRLAAEGLAPPRTESGVSSSRPSGSTGTESGAQANQAATATGNPAVAAAQGATTDANQTRPNVPAQPTLMVGAVRAVAPTCDGGR